MRREELAYAPSCSTTLRLPRVLQADRKIFLRRETRDGLANATLLRNGDYEKVKDTKRMITDAHPIATSFFSFFFFREDGTRPSFIDLLYYYQFAKTQMRVTRVSGEIATAKIVLSRFSSQGPLPLMLPQPTVTFVHDTIVSWHVRAS